MGRCDNFPASFSARESALKFLSASASAATAAAAVSALAGVRVGVSIVISFPAGAVGHAEPEGRCNSLYAGM